MVSGVPRRVARRARGFESWLLSGSPTSSEECGPSVAVHRMTTTGGAPGRNRTCDTRFRKPRERSHRGRLRDTSAARRGTRRSIAVSRLALLTTRSATRPYPRSARPCGIIPDRSKQPQPDHVVRVGHRDQRGEARGRGPRRKRAEDPGASDVRSIIIIITIVVVVIIIVIALDPIPSPRTPRPPNIRS